MRPTPLYTPEILRGPAYQLRYGWTGWSAEPPVPPLDLDTLFGLLDPAWETDGLRRLEHRVVSGTWTRFGAPSSLNFFTCQTSWHKP